MIPHENTGFTHLGLAPKMLGFVKSMNFTKPTPIQHRAIPIALEGSDIVGVAQTGTGKTMAFGIPLIQRLMSTRGKALVVVPTRELALQVEEVLVPAAKQFQLKTVVLIGGASTYNQIKKLRKNPSIIIATPGRLIDHLQQRNVQLKDVKILVLDEADRMLDMGFKPQIDEILRSVSNDRQTMLFSATMPPEIIKLASKEMKLPVHVEIAPSGTAAQSVTQELFIVSGEKKKDVVRMLLDQYLGSVLLFTRTKNKAKNLTRYLRDKKYKAAEIHSDRSMAQRKQAINGFKTGEYRVLIATDIASRGLDVTGIELVINYDLPEDIENYVHRIGRTGRAEKVGHAVSLATPDQGRDVQSIEKLIRKELPRSQHPDFPPQELYKSTSSKSRGGGGYRGGGGRSRKSGSQSRGGGSKFGGSSSGSRGGGKFKPRRDRSRKNRARK